MNKEEVLDMSNRHLKSYQKEHVALHLCNKSTEELKRSYEELEKNFETSQEVIHNLTGQIQKLTHPNV